ncbi:unnamed protein product [Camellia sinensis]
MRFNYLVQAFLYTLLSSSSMTATQPSDLSINTTAVLDIEGHELQSSTKYYTFPVESPNRGGGLTLASKDGTCPYYVMQESFESSNGLPLRFLTVDNNKTKSITLSTDVNIAFFAATTCVQSTVWRVGGVSEVTGRRYVRSGGVAGRPGGETVNNWFRIEKDGSGNGYKIVFCPSVCGSCKVVCGDVAVFYEDGKRWLGLSDEPLLVMFKKLWV